MRFCECMIFYVKDPALRKRFQEIYDRCAKIVPGSPAFDFMFTDIAGQAVELKISGGNTCSLTCGLLGVFLVAMKIWLGRNWRKSLKMKISCSWLFLVIMTVQSGKSGCGRILREKYNYMGSDRSFMDFYMIRGIPRFILIARMDVLSIRICHDLLIPKQRKRCGLI